MKSESLFLSNVTGMGMLPQTFPFDTTVSLWWTVLLPQPWVALLCWWQQSKRTVCPCFLNLALLHASRKKGSGWSLSIHCGDGAAGKRHKYIHSGGYALVPRFYLHPSAKRDGSSMISTEGNGTAAPHYSSFKELVLSGATFCTKASRTTDLIVSFLLQ